MNAKIVILLGLAALAAADRSYRPPRPRYSSPEPYESSESFESYESDEAQYNFDWSVQHGPSGNNYGHEETRNGDNTEGYYYMALPDGRLQKVTYYVNGDDGYVADFKYDREARYDSGSYESRSFESGSFESGTYESYESPRYGK